MMAYTPRQKRTIRVTSRSQRAELIRRGWGMRGAYAEKVIGEYRLVISGRHIENGKELMYLSFHPSFRKTSRSNSADQ
jgi:hypothetical protein